MSYETRPSALLHSKFSLGLKLSLIATALCLSGCGFVLAPLEAVTVGSLRTVVKEIDKQTARIKPAETQVIDGNSASAASAKDDQASSAVTTPSLNPTPGHPSIERSHQISRLSLMPLDHSAREN